MSSFGLLPQDRFQMIYNEIDLSRVKSDPQRAIDFRRVIQFRWIGRL